MKIKIYNVAKNSIAAGLGIKKGDFLLNIGGKEVGDIFDYKFLTAEEYVELFIEKANGDTSVFQIEKDEWEDLGIEFENWLIDNAKSCRNKCVFCFIDQLPKGMRETLYFKDDDARLSFIDGNYVTLTNMSDKDIEKIINYRFSPINISVHAADPELRVKILNNKNAGKSLKYMERLAEARIALNFQTVLVKNLNDGHNLENTIEKLSKYIPEAQSLSVVPAGLTKYREGLYPIESFTKEDALNIIEAIEKYQRIFLDKYGTRFVFCSDEFYITAEKDIPGMDFYEDFCQLENGVGMISLFTGEAKKALRRMKPKNGAKTVSIITGTAAYPYIRDISKRITDKYRGLDLRVFPVINDFFGEKITVSGLLTGRDIISQLEGKSLGDAALIPKNALKAGENVFLDDITADFISQKLKTKVIPVRTDGAGFISEVWRI